MSNADTPAENVGGNAVTPTEHPAAAVPANPLGELPPRVRVHALAKLLGSSSRDVLAKLTELGESARSAQSSVPREVAVKVAEALAGPAQEPEAPAAQAPAARQPPAQPEPRPRPEPEPGSEPARPLAHVPVFAAQGNHDTGSNYTVYNVAPQSSSGSAMYSSTPSTARPTEPSRSSRPSSAMRRWSAGPRHVIGLPSVWP